MGGCGQRRRESREKRKKQREQGIFYPSNKSTSPKESAGHDEEMENINDSQDEIKENKS
jgi:hypothetical protein